MLRTWHFPVFVPALIGLFACSEIPSNPEPLTPSTEPGTPSEPLPPSSDTRVAFVSTREGSPHIYVAKAGGSDITRLASGERPAWSRDRQRIAFHRASDGNDGGAAGIFVMNADGSAVKWLANGWNPAWSPDGTRIVFSTFVGTDEGGIFVVNADGSRLTRLLSHDYARVPRMGDHCVCEPTWSPDGRRIAFIYANYEEPWQIHIMNADGSAPRRLPTNGSAASPDWSPDGTRIAFEEYDGSIASVDMRGALWKHVQTRAFGGRPGWSPDGRYLVFAQGVGLPVSGKRIFVVSIGTGSVRQLIPEAVSPAQPSYDDYDPAW